jgi:toluene monooxygenase system ferredoxin subunit
MTVVTRSWRAVATLDDLWEGEMMAVDVEGLAIVFVNIDGDVFAYEDRCPHLGTPLSRGYLDGASLMCAAHEWVFDCRLGRGINPANACLRSFDVRVDSDVISIRLERRSG